MTPFLLFLYVCALAAGVLVLGVALGVVYLGYILIKGAVDMVARGR